MKALIISVITLVPLFSFAQSITKTADGEGTILLKGTSISIDVGKTDFTFGANNLQNSIGSNSHFIFGGNLQGENKEGISTLFSKGDAVPSGTLHAFTGWSFSNATSPNKDAELDIINKQEEKYADRYNDKFKARILGITESVCRGATLDKLKKAIKAVFKDGWQPFDIEAPIKVAVDDPADILKAKAKIQSVYDDLKKNNQKTVDDFEKRRKNINDVYSPRGYKQLLLFGFADYSTTQFKHLTKLDSVNYTNSFEDINSRGDKIGLGMNLQLGSVRIGFTYDHSSANNFDLLSKKTYTFKKTLTSGTQSLTEQKDITAYSGDYGNLKINEVAADLIFNIKLDEKAKNHMLINPYSRIQTSTNTILLPNTLNIGCGFYFFQQSGKFLGGVYMELPDVNNNYEKMKPTADQQLRGPFQRLTFGLVGKISLSSVLNIY